MGSVIKLRLNDLGGAVKPRIRWVYTDGFDSHTGIEFEFVNQRTEAFQAVKGPDLNQALVDAIELDLVPSGDWAVTQDQYYLYIETTVPGRIFQTVLTNTIQFTYIITNITDADIEYTESLPSDAILNAFNDNIIKFKTPGLSQIQINANGELAIPLFPNPYGEYELNLKDFATTLINKNKFKDEITPDIGMNGYVYEDPTVFLPLEISMGFYNFEEKAKFYFLKSVAQIENYKDKLITESHILLPVYGLSHKVTYYEGYPFDIPIFSDQAKAVTIKNKTTGHSTQMQLERYINRLFLSQGSENFTIDDVLPMQTGFNRLELDFGNKAIDLVVNKKESQCAPYFKFYRNSGGWGYIRFNPELSKQIKTKDGKDVSIDYNGIQNTLTRYLNEGKEITVGMECYTELLEPWEMENFKDFVKSPRVEMYVSDLFQKQTENSWIGVRVKSNSLDTVKRKTKLNREKVKIEFAEYNLHL